MANRPVLQNGDVFTAEIANAIAYPIVDGADFLGHGPKVIDEYLDDAPTQLKSRFYNFYDRLKVSHNTGLTFSYLGGIVLLSDGSTASISPGSIPVPNNTTSYIFVGNNGVVQTSTQLPNECFPLALVITNSGTLSGSVIDLRDKIVDRISTATIPVQQLIPSGSGMEFWGSILPSGWLWQDGSLYEPSQYPTLFAAIGYTYGQSGTGFRVPDKRGRVGVGAGQGSGLTNRLLGQTFGEENVTLTTSQIPSHSHGVNEPPHSHGVNEAPHTHLPNDPGHAHSLNPFRRYAEGNGKRGDGAELTTVSGGSNSYPNTASSTTGISINASKTNLSISPSITNISINPQGGNGSHNNIQPSIVANYIIKI